MTATQEFRNKVRKRMESGQSRERATVIVARLFPSLHQRMLLEANAGRPQARKLVKSRAEGDDDDDPSGPPSEPAARPKKKRTRPIDDEGDDEVDDEDDDDDETGNLPDQRFMQLVRQEQQRRGITRAKAAAIVGKREPKLHRAFLLATNHRAVHGKIRDRFAGKV